MNFFPSSLVWTAGLLSLISHGLSPPVFFSGTLCMPGSFKIVSFPGIPRGGRQVQIPSLLKRFSKRIPLFLLPRPINPAGTEGAFPSLPTDLSCLLLRRFTHQGIHAFERELLSLNDHTNEPERKNLLWEHQIMTLPFLF